MMSFEHLLAFSGLVSTIIGATWVLRAALDDVAGALRTHVATDDIRHTQQDSRMARIEQRMDQHDGGLHRAAMQSREGSRW